MLKGDLSNEVPRRLLVTWDYLTDEKVEPRKVLGVVVGTATRRVLNAARLADLHRLVDRVDVRCELVVFGADDDAADSYLQNLDRRTWHPFTHARGYADPYQLISDLPYRREVLGVIDTAERGSAYGSYGIDSDYLTRAI